MKIELEQDVKGLLPEKDYDRRDFIWTALGASAALAVASSASGQQIVTDTAGLDVADVMIPAKDAQLRSYRAMPASGGPFPVVLVCAEIFGLNPYMKDICRRLAKAGYYAVVPDLYTRKADLTKISDMKDIMPIVNSKYDTELVGDYDATVAYAAASGKADTNRMAVTGFCRGGRTTLIYAASNPKLKAAAAWYGPVGGQTNEYTPKNRHGPRRRDQGPVLGLYGGKDAGIPVEQVQKFFDALKAQGTPAELVVYPDAGHGFNADFRPTTTARPTPTTRGARCLRGSRSTAPDASLECSCRVSRP
jgi:carboxymethylenebutenolidase